MILDKRLSAVLDKVNAQDLIADVGADHAYLTKALLDKGIPYAQVIENKIGPLENAKKTLIGYDNVEFNLSNGLDDLADWVNTIIICGMGGLNIVNILKDHLNKVQKVNKIIVQPNSKTFELRLFIVQNGFEIIDEDIIKDGNHYYQIIVFQYQEHYVNLNNAQLTFGPINLLKQKEELKHYGQHLIDEYNQILEENKFSNMDDRTNLISKIKEIIENIEGIEYANKRNI